MSSYTRAPLPQTHSRRWAVIDKADAEMEMDVEEDLVEKTPAE
jgi:hypothetical protein